MPPPASPDLSLVRDRDRLWGWRLCMEGRLVRETMGRVEINGEVETTGADTVLDVCALDYFSLVFTIFCCLIVFGLLAVKRPLTNCIMGEG